MRNYFSIILLFVSTALIAQIEKLTPKLIAYEQDLRAEMLDLSPWEDNPKLYELSDSEKLEPTVYINEMIAEYIEFPHITETQTQVFNYRMTYKRVHINEDKGVEGFNKIYIPVKSKIDLVDLRAHTFSKDGKKSREFNEDDMKTIEEEGSKFLILALDGVEVGGEVEFIYIVRKGISEYNDITVQGSTLKRNFDFTLRIHKNIEYQFKSYNNCPNVKEETIGDYNIYTLNVKNVPLLPKEEMQSYDAELMRVEYLLAYLKSKGRVRLNTFADFTKSVYNNIMAEKDDSKSEIKKLAKKLELESFNNTEDKIRTIENWIKSNIVYVDKGGLSSIKEIIKNRYASELGLLRLYVYLFNSSDIKYELWSTCDRNDKVFDENFESYNFLNNYCFYFPSVKKFIELKNVGWRLGLPPSNMLGQKAVQIKIIDLGDDLVTSKYTIGSAKTPSCDETNEIMQAEISLESSMSKVKVNLHTEEKGYQNYVRGIYGLVNDAAQKKEIVEDHLKRLTDDAKITKVEIKNENINDLVQVNKPLILDAEYTSLKMVENAGENIIIKIGLAIGKQSELYNEKPRHSKIYNYYPHKYTRTITLNIPDGYTAKGLEAIAMDKRYKLKLGDKMDSIGFTSSYVLIGNKLTINCIEYYDCLEWPLANSSEYIEVINSAADFNKISVILEPFKK